MSGLNFKIEVFEGPLDLMLTLIAKHKLNIQDIEISVLLEQFLIYMGQAQEADIELAGEFMEAAARLIYIKTASLLPKHEAETLKKELEGALIEYALCKTMAEKLRLKYIGGDVFAREALEFEPDNAYGKIHGIEELFAAASALTAREKREAEPLQPVSAALNTHYVTVFTKIMFVLRKAKQGGRIEIKKLFRGQKRSEQVATFLALLELSSHGRIRFNESLNYIEAVR